MLQRRQRHLILFGFAILVSTIQNLCATETSTATSTETTTKFEREKVSSKFKAPNAETPPELARQWEEDDAKLKQYIVDMIPEFLNHTGSSPFDAHLMGVQAVLRYWNSPSHLVSAGLFHSIYGTEGFQGVCVPLSERETIQDMIGSKAEKLCWMFCMVDRFSFDRSVFAWEPKQTQQSKDNNNEEEEEEFIKLVSRPELGRFEITLTRTEWLNAVELSLADWLEQVEGAASKAVPTMQWDVGQAYAYRRLAYRKMAQVLIHERSVRLSNVVSNMLRDVMETEDESTRLLVQMKNAPVSEASAKAWDALRSAGEDVPTDFKPKMYASYEDAIKLYCSDLGITAIV